MAMGKSFPVKGYKSQWNGLNSVGIHQLKSLYLVTEKKLPKEIEVRWCRGLAGIHVPEPCVVPGLNNWRSTF